MSRVKIFTLPSVGQAAPEDASSSLKEEIEAGLIGTEKVTVPGDQEVDREWSYRRSIPTVTLYDEQGLRLYDDITAKAKEYYLFDDELELLKTHGVAIARAMGFPRDEKDEEEDRKQEGRRAPLKRWRPAKWGDTEVGKWNGGVNGEEGLAGGVERGWDVVELGAGALRKTGHLLTALSSTVSAGQGQSCPITYHPLDLSYPELERVLAEMDEAFGDRLEGKVDCIGLHGDYEAGLQLIREGKLSTLRDTFKQSLVPSPEALGSALEATTIPTSINLTLSGDTTKRNDESGDGSPTPSTPSDGAAARISPGQDTSSLSELALTDDSTSGGTWSPVESEDIEPTPGAVSPIEVSVESSDVSGDQLSAPPAQHSTEPADEMPSRPLHFVFLGSSIGNFSRDSAGPFLASLPLRQGDTLLLGLDGRPSPGQEGRKKLEMAYNDPAGHTRAFEEHGWDVVRKELGLVDDKGMEFVGRYNEVPGRHEAYLRSKGRQTFHLPLSDKDVTVENGELLNIEWSYKYSLGEALDLFDQAKLRVVDSWKAPHSEYRLWLLERPSVSFTTPSPSSGIAMSGLENVKNVPKWEEWVDLWKLWDHITLDMIPKEMLHQKPIDLRHICLFYLGHIPTFLDIHLTRMTNGSHTEPEFFKDIFERGIDPDVDDPCKVHSHSEVPKAESDWPSLDEVLGFRDRVRQRLRGIYEQIESGQLELTRHVARVIFMTFEHEAQHAETLLYMLIQSPLTRAPTAVAQPQWEHVSKKWMADQVPNEVLTIPGGTITLGHDDVESEDARHPSFPADHELGWDNESPRVKHTVQTFRVDSLPISNAEYAAYLRETGIWASDDCCDFPASWVKVDGEWQVRTLYGPVSMDVAGSWPLMASKVEIEGYAKSKGGRLPTEPELRLLWESDEGPRPDGTLANVGFKNWHPVPPSATSMDNAGRVLHGHNGGVWEWTDTEFAGHEGFKPSDLYPGYSADFFDGKHFVVLGGSFATVPSIAHRKSFRNWYQANYRFSFIGGRVAYDN